MTPEIAIVDSNTLSCLGLQNLLEEIIPTAIIRSFRSFGELMDDTPDMYVHYFISSQIYFEHTAFFLERKPKTIVLVNGETVPQLSSMPTLNIYQDEQNLAKNILQLRQYGNQYRQNHGKPAPARHSDMAINTAAGHDLSAREIEVLVLITKGLINKEIADKLNISLTTVISHRKNITEKLGVGEAGGAVVHDVRLVAVLGEYVRQRLRQAHVVFNDEDLHGDLLSFARPSFHCTVRPEKRLKETGEGPFRERAASARALRRRQALSGNFQAARLGCGV